jgi:hypothetical protein
MKAFTLFLHASANFCACFGIAHERGNLFIRNHGNNAFHGRKVIKDPTMSDGTVDFHVIQERHMITKFGESPNATLRGTERTEDGSSWH